MSRESSDLSVEQLSFETIKRYTESDLFGESMLPVSYGSDGSDSFNQRLTNNVHALHNPFAIHENGRELLSHDSISSVRDNRMIVTTAFDFFVNCVEKDPDIFIMNTAMTDRFFQDGTRDQILTGLHRLQKRHGIEFLHLRRLVLARHSAGHYNVLSFTKIAEEGYHLKVDCSLGKEMKDDLLGILYRLMLLYQDENEGATLPLHQWRCPKGRGVPRSASQARNGLNCGVFAARNVERLARGNESHHPCSMSNEAAPWFRKHMIRRIREAVDSDPNLEVKEVTKEMKSKRKRDRRKKDLHGVYQLDGGVIDLTGEEA